MHYYVMMQMIVTVVDDNNSVNFNDDISLDTNAYLYQFEEKDNTLYEVHVVQRNVTEKLEMSFKNLMHHTESA